MHLLSRPRGNPILDTSVCACTLSVDTPMIGATDDYPYAFRHWNVCPGVQLPGATPGNTPRDPVLRPVPDVRRTPHDAVFDPGEVEKVGTHDDQCARPRACDGSNDAGTDDAAAGA